MAQGLLDKAASRCLIPALIKNGWTLSNPSCDLTHNTRNRSAVGNDDDLDVIRCMVGPDSAKEAVIECAVCLMKMEEEGEEIRKLRCDHAFHKTCLDRWMEYGRETCPLCRDSLAPKMCEGNNPYKCRTRREDEIGGWPWSDTDDDISFNF